LDASPTLPCVVDLDVLVDLDGDGDVAVDALK
jgi:hypothetical protein